MENLKRIIADINSLFSYNNISTQNDIDKQLMSMFSLYKIEDIEELIRFTSQYNLAILNDNNITKELNQLLRSYKENPNIENKVFDNIVLSVKKLYRPRSVNLTYRQHCEEIFSLISNAIIIDSDPDKFLYELLYQKLLINQLNSEESIDDLINNDLTRYIPQEKLALVKQDFSDLLKLKNIVSIDDMMVSLSNIKLKLDTNSSCIKNKESEMHKANKNLNKTDFTSDSKEVVDEDNLVPDNISDDDQPDKDFAPDNEFDEGDELEQYALSLAKKKNKKINLSNVYAIDLDVDYDSGTHEIYELGDRHGCKTYIITANDPIDGWSEVVYTSTNEDDIKSLIEDYANNDSQRDYLIKNIQVQNLSLKRKNKKMTRRKRINLSAAYNRLQDKSVKNFSRRDLTTIDSYFADKLQEIQNASVKDLTADEIETLRTCNDKVDIRFVPMHDEGKMFAIEDDPNSHYNGYVVLDNEGEIYQEYDTYEEIIKHIATPLFTGSYDEYLVDIRNKGEYNFSKKTLRNKDLSKFSRKQRIKGRQRNLNTSIILEDEDEDNLDQTKVIAPDLPYKMKEEDLIEYITIELSKRRKLDATMLAAITSLSKKIDKAINLSQREVSLNRNYILLNDAAEEVNAVLDDMEELPEDDNVDNADDQPIQDDSIEADTSEENQSRINHSRRAKLKQDKGYRATSTHLSTTNKSGAGKSGLDILLSRYIG